MTGRGRTGVFLTHYRVFNHLMIKRCRGGATSTSSLHVCLDGSRYSAVLEMRLLWQSIPKNPNVKYTFLAGTNAPLLLASTHNWCSSGGKMGRCLSGEVRMLSSALLSIHMTRTLLSSGASTPNCLCKKHTPDIYICPSSYFLKW